MKLEKLSHVVKRDITSETSSILDKYWEYFLDEFGIPVGKYFIRLLYAIYINFTLFNVILILVKSIPTGIYMHRLIKHVYGKSQERMKLKQLELEDIKLQIHITNTKLSVRNAQFTERKKFLRKKAEHLKKLRLKVRELIVADEELQNAIHHNPPWEQDKDIINNMDQDEGSLEWCKKDQFVCANARQCLDVTKVRDGTSDSPLGDDKKICVALGDEIENNEVFPYNEEGFVMVRKHGVWGRLCVKSFKDVVNQAHSTLKLPDLGRAVCRAMTFHDSSWVREARQGRKVSSIGYWGRKFSSIGYWEVCHKSNARAADTRLTFKRSACARHRALRVRCEDLDCGIRPHADAQQPRSVTYVRVRWGRVVGAGGAAAGAWSWQAALYRDGDFQCGVTLISTLFLLSASHCFYQTTEAHWVARLGTLRRGAWPRGTWERVTRVRQVVLHPKYAPREFRNDMALLRVDPLPLHVRLRPACLPPSRAQPPAGHYSTVVGWEQLYEHECVFPDTLQEVQWPVISTAECRRRTRQLPLYRITDDISCATNYELGGRDVCLGDSGGSLIYQEDDCARANRPGVYTKVSNYIEWTDSVTTTYTPTQNKTNSSEEYSSSEDFYAELETAEHKRVIHKTFDTCRGFRCPLGECLPHSSVCNGFLECSDGSDEWQCIKIERVTQLTVFVTTISQYNRIRDFG